MSRFTLWTDKPITSKTQLPAQTSESHESDFCGVITSLSEASQDFIAIFVISGIELTIITMIIIEAK